LNRYRSDTIVSFNVKGNYKPLLENNLVVSINGCPQTNDSLLWVGTETGLARFNTRTAEYELFNTSNTNFSNEVIKTIHIQNDTLLWLGTDFGLNILNTNTGKVTTYYHDPMVGNTIASNVVWEIYEETFYDHLSILPVFLRPILKEKHYIKIRNILTQFILMMD